MSGVFEGNDSVYKRFTTYAEDSEDGEFLKSLYPPQIMKIQLLVEDECDKLEYDGSIMFDQYPDKVRILKIADRIHEQIKLHYDTDLPERMLQERSLVEVLVINEIMRRRIRRRSCRIGGFC